MEPIENPSNQKPSTAGVVSISPEGSIAVKEQAVTTAKLVLEVKKLTAEVREIRVRNKTAKRSFFHNEVRMWVALVGGLLTGLVAIATVVIQAGNFLDQRKSESQFRIKSEIISLVNQLNDPHKAKRDNAAFMLSFFGEDPVPILINQLDVPGKATEEYPSPESIRKSLELIIRRDPENTEMIDRIIGQLRTESKKAFAREFKDQQNITALQHYTAALQLLRHVSPDSINKTLNELRADTEKHAPEDYRDFLLEKLSSQ